MTSSSTERETHGSRLFFWKSLGEIASKKNVIAVHIVPNLWQGHTEFKYLPGLDILLEYLQASLTLVRLRNKVTI